MRYDRILFTKLIHEEIRVETANLEGLVSKIYYKDPANFRSNVLVTASNYQNSYDPYNALDPTTSKDQRWVSKNDVGNEKFIVQLKGIKFKINSYMILSENSNPNNAHMKSWNFSCSIDGKKWDVLHHEKDCPDLNGPSILKEYKVSSHSFYSYFKIEAINYSWQPEEKYKRMITIQQIDLFVKRVVRDSFHETILLTYRMIHSIFILIIMHLS